MGLSFQSITASAYRFGAFELHPERGTLLRGGARVKLQPQPLRVLTHLVHHAPEIVSRDDLAEAIWPDVHVDIDQSLNFCIRQIRAALNDSAPHPCFIETLPKQGYRFIAELDPLPATSPNDSGNAASHSPPLLPDPLVEKPVALGSHPLPPLFSSLTFSLRRRGLLAIATVLACTIAGAATFIAHRKPGNSVAPHRPTVAVNPEARDAYLRGRYLWFRGVNEEAGQAFRRSIELQPNYAPAWSGLADYYGQGAGGTLDPRDALPRAEAAARKAVELDPASAEAHLSLAAALYFNRWNFPAAQHEIDRALELNSRLAPALHFRAKILSSLEQHTEAIAAERAAAEIDPFARPWAMTSRLLLARHYEDARQSALNYLHTDPSSAHALASLEAAECAQGGLRECVATRTHHLDLLGDPAAASRLRRSFAQGGYRAVLLSDLADLQRQKTRQYVSPFRFAEIYVQLGRRDNAIDALNEALDQHDPSLLLLQNLALFDPLHDDPRYRSIVRHIGLPPTF